MAVNPVTRPREADTFDPMQACRTRMAQTCLTRMRTLRFCSTLIMCLSLLMVLMPSAHGFAMTAHGNTTHGTMTGADGDDTLRAVVLNGTMAALSHDKAAILAKASHHADLCCVDDDPSENTESSRHACMAACCSAIMIACRHPVGMLLLAETGPPLLIPTSASRSGIHPPPKSDRMT